MFKRTVVPLLLTAILATSDTQALAQKAESAATQSSLTAKSTHETTSLTGESPYSLLVSRSDEKSNVTLKRAAAFPVVYPVSTTVAFVRGTADEFKTEMNNFKEQSTAKKLAAPAAVLFLPLSALAGFMRAPVIAGERALTNKPFSKKAFCLQGEIEKLE